mgnify:CR=1 FL=1
MCDDFVFEEKYQSNQDYLELINEFKYLFTEEEFNRQNADLVYVDDFSYFAFDDSNLLKKYYSSNIFQSFTTV